VPTMHWWDGSAAFPGLGDVGHSFFRALVAVAARGVEYCGRAGLAWMSDRDVFGMYGGGSA